MRIVVVGDVLLDEDIDGVTTRLSPDAPVPVVDVSSRTRRAGGAGLVATMLAHDGADVTLVTALSFDDAAFAVRDCLRGVRVVAGDAHAPTPIKARLRAGGHAIARIDDVCGEPPEPEVTARMVAAIRSADAILVADYGRGLAAHPRIRDALEQRRAAVPLVWDPHPRGPAPVPSATLATPNVAEATQAARATSGTAEPERMAVELLARWRCAAVAVTIGDQGAVLCEDASAGALRAPAEPVPTSDPCGAGDRFAATAIAALAEGQRTYAAVAASVRAASEYIRAGGVATLMRERGRVAHQREDATRTISAEPHSVDTEPAAMSRPLALARVGRNLPA